MRFDLGTLDSGERSLPFGLLANMCSRAVANIGLNIRNVHGDKCRNMISKCLYFFVLEGMYPKCLLPVFHIVFEEMKMPRK